MSNLKQWFDEASVIKVFSFKDHEFVIYNGFKITHYKDDDLYTIQDTRLNDFYTDVSQQHIKTFEEEGFIEGANIILYKRNLARVDRYLGLIRKLYGKRKDYKSKLGKNKAFYSKGIRNINKNIHNYHDKLQFYQAKVDQYENNKNN